VSISPLQALRAAQRTLPRPGVARASIVVAGATGALGSAVLRRLIGRQNHAVVHVLAREAITAGLRGVALTVVPPPAPDGGDAQAAAKVGPKTGPPDDPFVAWPCVAADIGIVMFEAPRDFYERERALWTPQPAQLVPLARWMQRGGVRTLALVLPGIHIAAPELVWQAAQGDLPGVVARWLRGAGAPVERREPVQSTAQSSP